MIKELFMQEADAEEKVHELLELRVDISEKGKGLLNKVSALTLKRIDLLDKDAGCFKFACDYNGKMGELSNEVQDLLLYVKAKPKISQVPKKISAGALSSSIVRKESFVSDSEKRIVETCKRNNELTQRVNDIFCQSFEICQDRAELLEEIDSIQELIAVVQTEIEEYYKRWDDEGALLRIKGLRLERDYFTEQLDGLRQESGELFLMKADEPYDTNLLRNEIFDLSVGLGDFFRDIEEEGNERD
ncbi:MAG: hypothetical protein ACI9S8_002504 [Chlamydiales bacterium]|jgi:hypothetical protein